MTHQVRVDVLVLAALAARLALRLVEGRDDGEDMLVRLARAPAQRFSRVEPARRRDRKKTSRVVSPAVIARQTAPGPACQRRDRDRGDRAQKGWVGRGVLARRGTHVANVDVAYTARWATAERERGGEKGEGEGCRRQRRAWIRAERRTLGYREVEGEEY